MLNINKVMLGAVLWEQKIFQVSVHFLLDIAWEVRWLPLDLTLIINIFISLANATNSRLSWSHGLSYYETHDLMPDETNRWIAYSVQPKLFLGFLRVAGGNWGRLGTLLQHCQPSPIDSPFADSTDPTIPTFSNMTFISTKSSTVKTLDRRTSWAPRRNRIKALLHPPWSLSYPPHHPFGSGGWHHLQ